MNRLRPRPLVDLVRKLTTKPAGATPTHHFGVIDSVQATTATLSNLDGSDVDLPGVAWVVPPTAGQTVLLAGFGGRMLIVGPIPYVAPSGGGGGGVAGVASFNTRTGAVTLTKSDVTGTGLAAADVAALPASAKGAASGVASLDTGGKVPAGQLPSIVVSETYVVSTQAAMLALAANVGDVAVRTDLSESFILTATPASTLGNWQQLLSPTSAVSSVFGRTGAVTLTKADVTGTGLAAADVGAATTAALTTETSRATTAEGLLAPKASPALTGTPTAPTAAAGTNTTQVATTAFSAAAAAARYGPGNAPPYPVTTVAGRTGAIVLAEGDITSLVADLAAKYSAANPPPVTASSGLPTASAMRNAGDVAILTPAYTNWAAVDTALDISLAANVGDVIEYWPNAMWVAGPYEGRLDVFTVVNGVVAAAGWSGGTDGYPGWLASGGSNIYIPIGGPALHTVVAGDLYAGRITMRLMAKGYNASPGRTLFADATFPLRVYARNNGKPTAVSGDGSWNIVGASGQPAFANGFGNNTSGYANTGFRKDALGYVHLQGVPSIASSAGIANTVFTLPAGYRPAARKSFGTWAQASAGQVSGRIDVDATGNVMIVNNLSQYAILDGITFLAEQ